MVSWPNRLDGILIQPAYILRSYPTQIFACKYEFYARRRDGGVSIHLHACHLLNSSGKLIDASCMKRANPEVLAMPLLWSLYTHPYLCIVYIFAVFRVSILFLSLCVSLFTHNKWFDKPFWELSRKYKYLDNASLVKKSTEKSRLNYFNYSNYC